MNIITIIPIALIGVAFFAVLKVISKKERELKQNVYGLFRSVRKGMEERLEDIVVCEECGVLIKKDKAKTVEDKGGYFVGSPSLVYGLNIGELREKHYYCQHCAPDYDKIEATEDGNKYYKDNIEVDEDGNIKE